MTILLGTSIANGNKIPNEIWTHLVVTHEGTSQVKGEKIDLLRSKYENFTMHDNDTIDDIVTRFTKITNGLASLGDVIDNDQKSKEGHSGTSTLMESQGYYIKEDKW